MVLNQDNSIPCDVQIKRILDDAQQEQKPLFDFECTLVFTDHDRMVVEEHKRMEYNDMLRTLLKQTNAAAEVVKSNEQSWEIPLSYKWSDW